MRSKLFMWNAVFTNDLKKKVKLKVVSFVSWVQLCSGQLLSSITRMTSHYSLASSQRSHSSHFFLPFESFLSFPFLANSQLFPFLLDYFPSSAATVQGSMISSFQKPIEFFRSPLSPTASHLHVACGQLPSPPTGETSDDDALSFREKIAQMTRWKIPWWQLSPRDKS